MSTFSSAAHWIWCQGEEQPKNFYLQVRKSFHLAEKIRRATIRMTADSRYQLYVNGTFVARGPARCDRRWQCVDEWEISERLHPGTNVIAALVHHYGQWTFAYMLGRGGFLAEVELETASGQSHRLASDETWKVLPAETWERRLPRMSIQLGFPEVYDARKEVGPWTAVSFNDSDWPQATLLGPAGMEPWPQLVPREIPPMREVPIQAEQVIDSGDVGVATTGHYVDLHRVAWSTKNGVAYLATFVWSPHDNVFEIHAGSQDAIRLWVNGDVLISHLVTRDPAPDQEIVPAHLHAGWNTILAKIVQGEGQWHFYFRIVGAGTEDLIYSPRGEGELDNQDALAPWWMIGPFESDSLATGFDHRYPPEQELALHRTFQRSDGQELRWVSAGVSAESMLTSVIMSREERFPSVGKAFEGLQGIIAPGAPAIVYPGAQQGRYIVIDFGKEVAGHPVIEIDGATGGEIIELGYAEALHSPTGEPISPASGKIGIVNPDRAGVHYADRYICKAGKQRFQTFDKRAFRYLQVDVRNLQAPITLGPVSLLFSTYPVEFKGSFECSDPVLNKIWDVGRWTVQLNMEDAYTDCPWRERGQWWGDARVQALVNYYAFGDVPLVRQGLRQIAQSQRDDGWTMGIYPTEWSYGVLPTFTLLWMISLHDYYLFTGDRVLLQDLFPSVVRAIPAFEKSRSEHDLLRDLPHWLFVDWADVATVGESAAVNALYHGGLLAAAGIAEALGERARGIEYRRLARRIQLGMMNHLWDSNKHTFRESWSKGTLSEKVSEQANCWAIAFGAAGAGTERQIIDSLFREAHAAIRTGTPYFAHYVLTALGAADAHEIALAYIRKQWTPMLEWGATTWWEQWEPKASFCHGWSSGPTWFLSAEILGVKPAAPGWEEILIAPHPADLEWARGKVPTPHGDVRVEWENKIDFSMTVETPRPARVVLSIPDGKIVTVHPEVIAPPMQQERTQTTEIRASLFLPEPGTYTIRS